jgi:hypothetical protein
MNVRGHAALYERFGSHSQNNARHWCNQVITAKQQVTVLPLHQPIRY